MDRPGGAPSPDRRRADARAWLFDQRSRTDRDSSNIPPQYNPVDGSSIGVSLAGGRSSLRGKKVSLSQVDLTGGVQSTGLPAPAITAINSATTVQLDRWEDDDQYCEEALWAQHSAPVLGEFDRLGIAEANKRQQLVEAQRRAQERVAERERGKERKQQPGTIHAATATPPGSRGEPEVVEEKEEPKRDPLIGLPQGMSRAAMEEAHRRAKEQYQASQSPMSPQARNCLTPGDVVTMKNLLQAMVEAVALNEAARALENVPLALEEYQATCFQMEAEKERADAAVRKAEERWQKERARTARRRAEERLVLGNRQRLYSNLLGEDPQAPGVSAGEGVCQAGRGPADHRGRTGQRPRTLPERWSRAVQGVAPALGIQGRRGRPADLASPFSSGFVDNTPVRDPYFVVDTETGGAQMSVHKSIADRRDSTGRAGAPLTESGNRAGSGEAPASARCRTEHSKRRGGLSAGRQKSMGQAAHRSTGVRPSSAVTLSPGRIASSIQRAPGPQFTRLGGSLGRWRIPHAYQTAGLQDGHGVGPHRHPQQGRLRPQSALVHLMERSGESCDAPLITISSKSRLTVPKGSSPGEAETPWWPSAQAEPAAYGAEPLRGPLQGTDNTTEVQHHRVYAMTAPAAPCIEAEEGAPPPSINSTIIIPSDLGGHGNQRSSSASDDGQGQPGSCASEALAGDDPATGRCLEASQSGIDLRGGDPSNSSGPMRGSRDPPVGAAVSFMTRGNSDTLVIANRISLEGRPASARPHQPTRNPSSADPMPTSRIERPGTALARRRQASSTSRAATSGSKPIAAGSRTVPPGPTRPASGISRARSEAKALASPTPSRGGGIGELGPSALMAEDSLQRRLSSIMRHQTETIDKERGGRRFP